MDLSFDYIKDNYKELDKEEISEILLSENPEEELLFRVEIDEAIKEEEIMNMRNKLNETYKKLIEYEAQNN